MRPSQLFPALLLCSAVLRADFFINDAKQSRPSTIHVDWHSPSVLRAADISRGADSCLLRVRTDVGPVELQLSFPKGGGIRLHSDVTGFFVPESVEPITYSDEPGVLVVRAGSVTARIHPNALPWTIDVASEGTGTTYTLRADQLFFGYQGSDVKKVGLKGPIHRSEILFGLGERFNALNQVGWRVRLWNKDSYNGLMDDEGDKTLGYKNVPILHSNRGWSLFFNSSYSAQADIGQTPGSEWSFDFNGPVFDVYLWLGTPLENLRAYTDLTGKPIVPPRWAFRFYAGAGGQVWKVRGEDKYLDVLRDSLEGYKRLGTPLAALYGEGLPCKNPEGYRVVVDEYGVRMLKWFWSAMGKNHMRTLMPDVPEDDLPCVVMNSNPKKVMGGAYIDFSHPRGADAVYAFFKKWWELGCRGTMVDFGDNIFVDSRFHNGMTGEQMHNFYAYLYNKGYHDAWERGQRDGLLEGGYILFSRSGTAGSQRWVGQFGGDHPSTFQGLRQVVLGAQTAGTAGFSLWGSDIGGYGRDKKPPSPDCYMRWFQFGTFCPLMRIHGTTGRDPWAFGKEAEAMYKDYYWLRENLLDTIYSGAVAARKTGLPMIKAMPLAFPGEPAASRDDQYIFCDRLLVAPVLEAGATTRPVAFPSGYWVDFWTGEPGKGGETREVDAPQDVIPVFLAGGVVLRIRTAPSLRLKAPMTAAEHTEALLVAAGASRTSTHWLNEAKSVTYTVSEQPDGGLRVDLPEGGAVPVVIVRGLRASTAQCGALSLKRLSALPTDTSQAGFFADPSVCQTVVRLPMNPAPGSLVLR